MTTERGSLEETAVDAERPLWQLNHDEQRILIITFVGSLASIVTGAVIIGGAIALVHSEKGLSLSSLVSTTGLAVLLTAMSAVMVLVVRKGKFVKLWKSDSPIRTVLGTIYLGMLVLSALGLIFTILTWIGVAAGIH